MQLLTRARQLEQAAHLGWTLDNDESRPRAARTLLGADQDMQASRVEERQITQIDDDESVGPLGTLHGVLEDCHRGEVELAVQGEEDSFAQVNGTDRKLTVRASG